MPHARTEPVLRQYGANIYYGKPRALQGISAAPANNLPPRREFSAGIGRNTIAGEPAVWTQRNRRGIKDVTKGPPNDRPPDGM